MMIFQLNESTNLYYLASIYKYDMEQYNTQLGNRKTSVTLCCPQSDCEEDTKETVIHVNSSI